MGHSEENAVDTTAMGGVVALDGTGRGTITGSGELWRKEEIMVGKCAPLLVDGRLYLCEDSAKLHVLDAATGEPIARRPVPYGTFAQASPLYADGRFYVFTRDGRWYTFVPDDRRGVKRVNSGRIPNEECLGSPICAQGRIYLPTTGALYCLADASKTPGMTDAPPRATEPDVSTDTTPAHLQVIPAELLVRPGAEQAYTVRLFNARGQFLRESEASFQLDGPGTINDAGEFTAPSGDAHAATVVTAQVGELKGRARVRIVPDLPWTFDFDELSQPPITWVGARYRHVIREVDGDNAMVKVTTIPKGTRSRCWFGHSDLSDYTIQAEVKGAIQDGKMPDIGVIAQGYAMDLQGASQQLQVRSWVTQLRMAQTLDFAWKPNTWYAIKLSVRNENGKAIVRGKVWPKDQSEPGDWTIEAVDEAPVTSGSPGLYGNAKDAEIYLDNIRVYTN
jgi:hypothetical protein